MENFGLLSLLPAFVTILVAIFSRRVALALFCGVVAGAFLVADYQIIEWVKNLFRLLSLSFTDLARLKIVFFLLLMGAMLKITSVSGAYEKFADVLSKTLNTAKKSRLATWALSFMLFFDDYANVLISGSSMRRINERNGVSRAFLAYMVDVLAIMASIMLISTWASFECTVMGDAGKSVYLQKNATILFIESLPYHFYTFSAVLLTLFVAFSGRWFGYRIDKQKFSEQEEFSFLYDNVHFSHVLIPFISFISCSVVGLFLVGIGITLYKSESLQLMTILGNAPAIEVLIVSSIIALFLTFYLMKRDKVLNIKQLTRFGFAGMKEMSEVCLIIIVATGLSLVSDELGTGKYIANSLTKYLNISILPVLIFVISMLITAATGFSWSSMAIVMPIGYSLAIQTNTPELIPILSAAVVTGAVSGEHFIPYSEKAVMTATACQISPIYHIKTQFLQTILSFSVAALGFLLLGFRINLFIVYLSMFLLIAATHFVFAKANSK